MHCVEGIDVCRIEVMTSLRRRFFTVVQRKDGETSGWTGIFHTKISCYTYMHLSHISKTFCSTFRKKSNDIFDLSAFGLISHKQTCIQLIQSLKAWHNMSFAPLMVSWENTGSQQVQAVKL